MLKKCNTYPNCSCYAELVQPVEKLGSTEEAEFFAGALKEIDDYCTDTYPISFEGIKDFIQPYLADLPVPMKTVFTDILLSKLTFHYSWKMPKPTLLYQLKKYLMENGFKPTSLSDLEKNNDEFDRLVLLYKEKQRTASRFIDLEDFVEAELKRIKNQFIKPLTILNSNAPVRTIFNHSAYCEFAFKKLSEGHDWSLLQVKEHALSDYKMANDSSPYNIEEFNSAIIGNCKRGVAYLMYSRFLKEKQKELIKVPVEKVDSVAELADFSRQIESRKLNHLVQGLKTLQDYVMKNVFQNMTRDLLTLERLERELTAWKSQLQTIFINNVDVNHLGFMVEDIDNRKSESVQNILVTIDNGLQLIALRKNSTAGNTMQPSADKINERPSTLMEIINEHLTFMKGRNPKNNHAISSPAQYDQIVTSTAHFMETGKVPDELNPVGKLNMTNESLVYTFRELYKSIHPKGKLPYAFFSFLNSMFAQLTVNNLNESNYKNFAIYKKGASKPRFYNELKKG